MSGRTRDRCPARRGRDEASLRIVDALDVPACLVYPGAHGPCEDCTPDPPLWRIILDWIRERFSRRHR